MSRKRQVVTLAVLCPFLVLSLTAVLVGVLRSRKAVVVPDAPVAPSVTAALRLIAKFETAGESTSNVVGRIFDARGKTAADFRRALESLPGKTRHVWMPGTDRWFLVGHLATNRVSLAAALDELADVETAKFSLSELFASYVGTAEDVLPAFSSELKGDIVPEWFVSKEIPALDWLDTAGIDADILAPLMTDIRSKQVIRRQVLEGNMLAAAATDKPSEEKAAQKWANAYLHNPRDPMLLERLEILDRNARGFLSVGKVVQAMKCFETMILIAPGNAAAVHNFGQCLMKIGRVDLASNVLERAEVLANRVEALAK